MVISLILYGYSFSYSFIIGGVVNPLLSKIPLWGLPFFSCPILLRLKLFQSPATQCTALVIYGSNLSSTIGYSITKWLNSLD